MVGYGESFVINRQRIPEASEGITKGTIKEFQLVCKGWKGETEVVGGANHFFLIFLEYNTRQMLMF